MVKSYNFQSGLRYFSLRLLVLAMVFGWLLATVSGAHADSVTQLQASGDTQTKFIGALAWVEPSSRILRISTPSMVEGGKIDELYVSERQEVKKGEVLGVFATYAKAKASYDVAEANLMLAKANLEKVKLGNKSSDILSQEQRAESIKAAEVSAAANFDRIEKLFAQNLVSKTQYDTALAEKQRLKLERLSAESTLTSIKTVRPDDVKIAESEVKAREAELNLAQTNVDLAMIVAPIDGTILTIRSRSGEAVGDAGILDLADLTRIDAVAEVDERDILRVKVGQSAQALIDGLKTPVPGKVREIGGQIKRNAILDSNPAQPLDTRIVEVRIELDPSYNEQLKHMINMKIKAQITP